MRRAVVVAGALVGVGLVLGLRGAGGDPAPAGPSADTMRTVLDAYAAAVIDGDHDRAVACCLHPDRVAEVGEVPWIVAQARHADESGALRRYRLADPHALEVPDAPGVYRAVVEREGARRTTGAAFDFAETPDGWRIRRTWWWGPEGDAHRRTF